MSSQATTIKMSEDDLATPIDQLQGPSQQNQQQQGNNTINNIMNSYQDLEDDMDDENPEQVYERQMMNDVNEPHQQQYQDNVQDDSDNHQEFVPQQNNTTQNKTMLNQIIDNVKPSLIVFVLFIVLNQQIIINMINSLLQTTLGEESNYNLYGLVIRSIIASVIYYGLSCFC